MKESGLRVRVEQDLRDEFLVTCRKYDQTASQVLRAFMREYIHKSQVEGQSGLFKGSTSLQSE